MKIQILAMALAMLTVAGCGLSESQRNPHDGDTTKIRPETPFSPVVTKLPNGLQLGKTYSNGGTRYVFDKDTCSVWTIAASDILQRNGHCFAMTSYFQRLEDNDFSNRPELKGHIGQIYTTDTLSDEEASVLRTEDVAVTNYSYTTTYHFVDESSLETARKYKKGEWVPVLTDTPYTVADSSVRISWDSCTTGSACVASGCNSDAEILDVAHGGLALQHGDIEYQIQL